VEFLKPEQPRKPVETEKMSFPAGETRLSRISRRERKSIFGILRNFLRSLGWRLATGLLAAVGAAFFFGWLASEVFEGETGAFDDAIRGAIHQTATPSLTTAMIFFTRLGSVWGISALFIFASAVLLYLRHKRAAMILWIMMAGEVVLDIAVKNSFQRARPAPFFDFPLPASYSFPSGHAFASLCFFGAAARIVSTRTKNRAWKILVWLAAASLILIIGVSRIYLGVHYPSDVLAGYAAALVWFLSVVSADSMLEKRRIDFNG
jgi:membrane-associated phospholipid phosphatase